MAKGMEICEKFIKEGFPQINEDIYSYIESVLTVSREDFEDPEEVYEAIGEMLLEVSCNGTTEDDVKKVCNKIFKTLGLGKSNRPRNGIRVLDAPMQMSALATTNGDATADVQSIWMRNAKDTQSQVCTKKLQKAEAKIQQKIDKRAADGFKPVSGINPIRSHECQASAAQVLSKKDTRADRGITASGKITDIKIENFDVAFGEKVLIQGATISLAFGRRYGLVGRNGLGKTTLLKMIAHKQLRIPQGISILHVEQEVNGDDTPALEAVLEADDVRHNLLEEEKRLVAMNSPEAAGELSEVYAQLSAIEADKAPALAGIILAGLGFAAEDQYRPTRTFSGGWRMRLALARALFAKPDLLLIDEPSNHLDLKAIIWLENYLQTWKSTILVVSHDRQFLNEVATDILFLQQQTIEHYRGNYENFVKTRGERLKNQQREWDAQQQLRSHTQEFIDKFRYNAKRASLVQSKIKFLEKLPELKPVEKEGEVTLKFPEVQPLNPPVVQLDEVTFGYTSDKNILNKVNLTASSESRICIVGENGAGKSTLLKLILGELRSSSGLVQTNRGIRFGYFSQHHVDQLSLNLTPVSYLQQKFPGQTVEEYRRHLGRFGVSGDLALQSIASLSGGQKSRVAFTAMCYPSPNFLILDEPSNHLDVETIEALSMAIQNYHGGVMLVSHDEHLIRNVCKELWICGGGKVNRVDGGFEEYRTAVERELECVVYKS